MILQAFPLYQCVDLLYEGFYHGDAQVGADEAALLQGSEEIVHEAVFFGVHFGEKILQNLVFALLDVAQYGRGIHGLQRLFL